MRDLEAPQDSRVAVRRPVVSRLLRAPAVRRALGALCVAAWVIAVGAGLRVMWRYEATPGAAGVSPRTWPGSSLVSPRPDTLTLVMFVHPRCSCTRASLAELSEVMSRVGDRVAAWVLLFRPKGTKPEDWEQTPTREAAERIPNVTVVADEDGAEAARFGALTSGHVELFDARGQLLFAGGITGARGHAGDNSGRRSVLELAQGRPDAAHDHAVFGCSIHDHPPGGTRE